MSKDNATTIKEYHLNRHQPHKLQFNIYDLNDYLKKDRINTIKPHIHSFYQIIWFKSGRGKHVVDFKEYEVFDNAIFLISKNQVHRFVLDTAFNGLLIHFNETFFLQNDNDADALLKYDLFHDAYQTPCCRIGKDIALILDEYILQIRRELMNSNPFRKEDLLRIYLKSFLIQVQRKKNTPDQNKTNSLIERKRVRLIKFINLVEDNYRKGLTVTEYAALLFISSRSLSDLTGQLLNKTPSQIIQERIILEAQRLLIYSNLNISQIAYQLGFDDSSYFVKYFKKHTNASPSEFRKLIF